MRNENLPHHFLKMGGQETKVSLCLALLNTTQIHMKKIKNLQTS